MAKYNIGRRNAKERFENTGVKKAFSGDFGVAYKKNESSWESDVKEHVDEYLNSDALPTSAIGYAHLVLKDASKNGRIEAANQAIKLYEKFSPKKLTGSFVKKNLSGAYESWGKKVFRHHDDGVHNRQEIIESGDPKGMKAYMEATKTIEHAQETKREEMGGLESKSNIAIMIIGLFGGLFFLSSNITGNVIGSLTSKTSSIIGVGLFILGLVGIFIYYKRK